MSVAPDLASLVTTGSETREILGPAGNRVPNSGQERKTTQKKNSVTLKKTADYEPKPSKKLVRAEKPKAAASESENAELRNSSVVAVSSSDSSPSSASCDVSNGAEIDKNSSKTKCKVKKSSVNKPAKIVPEGVAAVGSSPRPIKRCDWITPNSEPLYIQFHDTEWGVPVRDDRKLFELLVLSQALAELSWSTILFKRDTFRIMFEEFDPLSISKYDEQKLLSLTQNGYTLLSEAKLHAVIENAKHLLKIQQEFGSFSNYCWRFVNNKQIKSGFRYGRQVPARTPKSELMSKDLMRRGFRCVGPTVLYSFMQVAGLVNDHLLTCFRFNECDSYAKMELNPKPVKTNVQGEAANNTCTSTHT